MKHDYFQYSTFDWEKPKLEKTSELNNYFSSLVEVVTTLIRLLYDILVLMSVKKKSESYLEFLIELNFGDGALDRKLQLGNYKF